MYWDKKMTLSQIAQNVGVYPQTILYHMKRLNISQRRYDPFSNGHNFKDEYFKCLCVNGTSLYTEAKSRPAVRPKKTL